MLTVLSLAKKKESWVDLGDESFVDSYVANDITYKVARIRSGQS